MTTPTGETVSERPNFAEVLATHHLSSGGRNLGQWRTEWSCACGATFVTDGHKGESIKDGNDAHLAAVLNAEVDRWLGDEGTRERVAEAGSEALVCKRTCPDDCDGSRCKTFRRLLASGVWLAAQPALAALATPEGPCWVPGHDSRTTPIPPTPSAVRGEGGEE